MQKKTKKGRELTESSKNDKTEIKHKSPVLGINTGTQL